MEARSWHHKSTLINMWENEETKILTPSNVGRVVCTPREPGHTKESGEWRSFKEKNRILQDMFEFRPDVKELD